MADLEINTIYVATEGEGVRVGTPQVFVRLQGCDIGCKNCDTVETWKYAKFPKTPLNSVVEKIQTLAKQSSPPLKWVSITGGNPLDNSQLNAVLTLIKELKTQDFKINIEAVGDKVVEEVFDEIDFISFDLKTPSTDNDFGLSPIVELIEKYPNKSQIKAVCGDDKDFAFLQKRYDEANADHNSTPWVITVEHNLREEYPKEKILHLMKLNESTGGKFRLILQQHKVLHGSKQKEV